MAGYTPSSFPMTRLAGGQGAARARSGGGAERDPHPASPSSASSRRAVRFREAVWGMESQRQQSRSLVGEQAQVALHKRRTQIHSVETRTSRFAGLGPVEQLERFEIRPYLCVATTWIALTTVLVALGAFLFPLQYRHYRPQIVGLLPVNVYVEWKCSVLVCSLSFTGSETLCKVLPAPVRDVVKDFSSVTQDLCEGHAALFWGPNLGALCDESTHGMATKLMGRACEAGSADGRWSIAQTVGISSIDCTVLVVISVITRLVVLAFVIRDFEVCSSPEDTTPRWTKGHRLRRVARWCAFIAGICCMLIGTVHHYLFAWVETDGGFLKKTHIGKILVRPEDRFHFSAGEAIWVALGILDLVLMPTSTKPLFKEPWTPIDVQLGKEDAREVIEMCKRAPRQAVEAGQGSRRQPPPEPQPQADSHPPRQADSRLPHTPTGDLSSRSAAGTPLMGSPGAMGGPRGLPPPSFPASPPHFGPAQMAGPPMQAWGTAPPAIPPGQTPGAGWHGLGAQSGGWLNAGWRQAGWGAPPVRSGANTGAFSF